MLELVGVPMRPLTPFERTTSKLETEEDVVIEPGRNRIEMLGSLRASKTCTRCHSVPEGTLLERSPTSSPASRPQPSRAPSRSSDSSQQATRGIVAAVQQPLQREKDGQHESFDGEERGRLLPRLADVGQTEGDEGQGVGNLKT